MCLCVFCFDGHESARKPQALATQILRILKPLHRNGLRVLAQFDKGWWSELSGRQAANRCGTMVWWELHKFTAFYEKTSGALRHKASEVFRNSSQIVVCAPDTATPVFIILTTSLSVPLLYSTQRKASPIQPCQKSAFCVRIACADSAHPCRQSS